MNVVSVDTSVRRTRGTEPVSGWHPQGWGRKQDMEGRTSGKDVTAGQ